MKIKGAGHHESYLANGGSADGEGNSDIDLDPLFKEAKFVVLNDQKTSISYLQRKLQIGYNRSANIILPHPMQKLTEIFSKILSLAKKVF